MYVFLHQDIYNFFEPVSKIYLFLFETQQHKELANWYEKNLFLKILLISILYSILLKLRNVKNAYTRLILLYLGFTLNKKPEWLNFSIPIFFFRERRPLNASLVIPHCGLLNAINVFNHTINLDLCVYYYYFVNDSTLILAIELPFRNINSVYLWH